MAKYAQGYERKSSDTKNLIILGSVIVAVVVLAIVAVVIYNKVKKADATFDTYSEYAITDYSETCTMEDSSKSYLIYVYDADSSATSDSEVLVYLAAQKKGNAPYSLYIVDYDDVDSSSSDSTITSNASTFKEQVKNYSYAAGNLFVVTNGKISNEATQIYTDSDKIVSGLKNLLKKKSAFGLD